MKKGRFFGIIGTEVLKNESLKKHTTFHIGGNASYFVYVYSKKALRRVLQITRKRGIRYFVIGAGTNILVGDKGFSGVVLKLSGTLRSMRRSDSTFICGGGLLIKTFLGKAAQHGYGGAEFLVGIPGTIGGGIIGNAGAFGRSFADITRTIFIMNRQGEERCLEHSNIGFDYRTSQLRHGLIVLAAVFKLRKRRQSEIASIMANNLASRLRRMPQGFSAGSFFKNPRPQTAGALIESCGLKGVRIGDAEVSTIHANWIINRGSATASDVVRLMHMIQKTVKKEKGIMLHPEVRILK